MGHVVAKEFKTVNRVMRVGTTVRPDDHLEPHSFDVMKARGFIKEAEPDVAAADIVYDGLRRAPIDNPE